LHQAAISVLRARFSRSSPAEIDVLAFYLLSVVTAGESGLKPRMDSRIKRTKSESLKSQMEMDRRSKFMSTLSNLLKKMSETSQQVASNIK